MDKKKKPNYLRFALSAALGAAIGLYAGSMYSKNAKKDQYVNPLILEAQKLGKNSRYAAMYMDRYRPEGLAGAYLSSLFAQSRQDWNAAHKFLEKNVKADNDNEMLLAHQLILAAGAGDFDTVFTASAQLLKINPHHDWALFFASLGAYEQKNYKGALDFAQKIPASSSLGLFVKPMMKGWAVAAQKDQVHVEKFVYYAAAITQNYLTKPKSITGILDDIEKITDLNTHNEILADFYVSSGHYDKARAIYNALLAEDDQKLKIKAKLVKLDNQDGTSFVFNIKNVNQGLAFNLFDAARNMLGRNDQFAHILTQTALHLEPQNAEYKVLLATLIAEGEQYEQAIKEYRSIPSSSPHYISSRRNVADLLEDHDRSEEAIAELQDLANNHGDLKSFIQIGDIYRRQEQFEKAVMSYDLAAEKIGVDQIIPDFWHLYYVRGMAHERAGNWDLAQDDLQKALDHKPDNPYILNYLGYAWADQGVNLKRSLEMIEKANKLAPNDGYITDSVGWVLYRLGRYEEAVPYLERAVSLRPYDAVINDHLGDSYWKVGRIREAKFQWSRAKNHIQDDDKLLASLEDKLENGLVYEPEIMQARSSIDTHEESHDTGTP